MDLECLAQNPVVYPSTHLGHLPSELVSPSFASASPGGMLP